LGEQCLPNLIVGSWPSLKICVHPSTMRPDNSKQS
jgi:hypothetical protein